MGPQDDDVALVNTVSDARRGDKRSMTRLAEEAEKRLYAYIYRLTLNSDLTEELLQQTLLKMVESLGQLREPEHFWPWLYRTALGQIQHHFRAERQRSQAVTSARGRESLSDRLAEKRDDGLTYASRRELTGIIFEAMSRIKLNYRNVVVLRCLEGMSYQEIADVLGCKELHARVLFFRGRNALRRQLSRRGYREGLLLTALGLFKLATGPRQGHGRDGVDQCRQSGRGGIGGRDRVGRNADRAGGGRFLRVPGRRNDAGDFPLRGSLPGLRSGLFGGDALRRAILKPRGTLYLVVTCRVSMDIRGRRQSADILQIALDVFPQIGSI